MAADNDNNLVLTVSSDMSAANRGIKKLVGDLATGSATIEKQFEKMGKGIDNSMTTALQTRIDKMVGIGTQAAKEWSGALADQGKELERLRARYNPLFATINTYKKTVADIKTAHSLGAISATEMAAAIQKERQAALASTAAIKGRNAAIAATPSQRGSSAGGSGYTSNIAAQFQDIGVTAAMGMSPMQIALQQGTQLSAVFSQMGTGKEVIKGLGAALASVISPVSLVTIGLVAAGAAAVQYFSGLDWGSGKSAETLQKEAELIDAVSQKWGDALPALKAYNDERQRAAGFKEAGEAAAASVDAQWVELRKKVEDLNASYGDAISLLNQYGIEGEKVSALAEMYDKLSVGVEKGTAKAEDAKSVQTELFSLFKDTGLPVLDALSKSIGTFADEVARAASNSGDLNKEALRLAGMDMMRRFPAPGTYPGVLRSADGTIQNDPYPLPQNGPTPTSRPLIELEGDGKEAQKAETAADKARNAYRDLIKSADDRISQLRLESEMLGQYGAATDAARFRLDLLQQSEDKGRSLSDDQKAEIEAKVAAYGKYSEALAQAKLQQDLLDGASMRGLSGQDQQIKQTLRQYGLPEDLTGKNAGDIRKQLQLDEIKSASDAFIDSLSGALLSGGDDIGKKLGQVLLNALMDSAQKQISGILKQLFGAVLGSGTSGSPIAAVTSAASTFAAPVGAVTRAALPSGDIAAYISKAASARGIDPSVALRVAQSEGGVKSWNMQSNFVKNGVQEPSFGPFQLYKGGGLGNDFMRQTGLDPALAQNGPAGVDFALDHAKQNGWGAWYGAPKAGVGKWDGIGTTDSSIQAVTQLGAASKETIKGLDKLGQGAGGLGATLSNLPQTLGGGAGGGLASLFGGGVSPLSSSWAPNTTLGSFLGLADGGRVVGPGTSTSDSIMAKLSNGEHVTRAAMVKKYGPLLDAINEDRVPHFASGGMVSGRVSAPVAPSINMRGGSADTAAQPQSLVVQISGASGDPHVRELVKQGVQQALAAQAENDRRGGFGNMQQRFVSQKG